MVEVFVNSGDEVSTGQKLMIIETEEFRAEEQPKNELKSEIKKELQTDSREEKTSR